MSLRGRAAWLLLPIMLACPAMASAVGKADKCMAGICLESKTNQKMLVAKYGPGRLRKEPGADADTMQRCYYDKKQGLYIEFTFDKHAELNTDSDLTTIMVSSVPMCPKRYAPKKPFQKFVTESGLRVGLTEAEVEAIKGKPDRIDDVAGKEQKNYANFTQEELMQDYLSSAYGGVKWMYLPPEDDLLLNGLYISDGKVKSLLLSDSE